MIALAAVLAAFAAPQSADPPQCSPRTVVTAPSTPIALAPDCTGTGANPTVTVITPPVGGTLNGFPGQYTPHDGFHGADHLIYTVRNNDTGETSAATTINLLVTAGRPSCADGVATTPANTPLKLSFACSEPNGGTVLIRAEDGRHGVVDPKVGTALTYTPEPGYVGTDEISFRGFTGAFETPPRTLTITITAPPSATPSPGPTASATPAPTVSAPAADKTAPSVSVKVRKASVAKGVAITLRSNEAGTVKLSLAARKHTATKSAKLVNGTTKVTLKLSAKARKALKSKRRVKATLTVASTDAAGNRVTKKVSVPLRR